jgi:hypothetical protein
MAVKEEPVMDIDLTEAEREAFLERAAIIEYMGNKPRFIAEREALAMIHKEREQANGKG